MRIENAASPLPAGLSSSLSSLSPLPYLGPDGDGAWGWDPRRRRRRARRGRLVGRGGGRDDDDVGDPTRPAGGAGGASPAGGPPVDRRRPWARGGQHVERQREACLESPRARKRQQHDTRAPLSPPIRRCDPPPSRKNSLSLNPLVFTPPPPPPPPPRPHPHPHPPPCAPSWRRWPYACSAPGAPRQRASAGQSRCASGRPPAP